MKKLTIFWMLILTLQVFTQGKPAALKFDEFSDYPAEKNSLLDNRTERFGKRMKSEPKTKQAVIIYYNQRKGRYPLEAGKRWAESAAMRLEYNYELPLERERIILIDGGYREYPTLEFWIVPRDAQTPTPTPAFTKDEIIHCPDIYVTGDGFGNDGKKPLNFSVTLYGAEKEKSFPMEWNVSAGQIVKGQGTNSIETDISQTKAKRITASVIVKELPPECQAHQFYTTQIGTFSRKVDEFGRITYGDMKARIQNVAVELANDPGATIQMFIYRNREGTKKDITYLMNGLNKSLDFLRLDRSRIKIVEGGYREEMSVEIYSIPAGVEPPKPAPGLNNDFTVPPKPMTGKRKKTK